MISGFIILNKPVGITSQQAVSKVKRIVGCMKAGHTGTLDPAAEGLLLIALGSATRLTEYFLHGDKGYRAEIFFGRSTDTGDREGNLIAEVQDYFISSAEVLAALEHFKGEIAQTPPQASAVKINGQRAYNLFRQGKQPDMPVRHVYIKSIQPLGLADITPANPRLVLDINCSKGTYIRSLAMDIGSALHVPAHLSGLIRTSLAHITLDGAAYFADLEEDYRAWLLDISAAVVKLPRLELDDVESSSFVHGRSIEHNVPDGELAVFSGSKLLGIAKARSGIIQPEKVLAQE